MLLLAAPRVVVDQGDMPEFAAVSVQLFAAVGGVHHIVQIGDPLLRDVRERHGGDGQPAIGMPGQIFLRNIEKIFSGLLDNLSHFIVKIKRCNNSRQRRLESENSQPNPMNKKMKSSDIEWHQSNITRTMRENLNGHRGAVIWFTGLSGSGKSTLAHAVEEQLHLMGCRTLVLDGDNVRHGLCSDLGFSGADRSENMRRIGEVAKLFLECGTIILAAFISPFKDDREKLKKIFSQDLFFEIYCDCSLSVCEERDTKGSYKKARRGEIINFTGISSPYEIPLNPDLTLDTKNLSSRQLADELMRLLREKKVI